MRIEQNLGPHIEQKRAVLAGSAGSVNVPQPVTYTAQATARNMRGLFGDRDFIPAAHMTLTPEFVFLPRIQIAFAHVAACVHATLPI
jgi:hypothetical protein